MMISPILQKFGIDNFKGEVKLFLLQDNYKPISKFYDLEIGYFLFYRKGEN